VAGMNRATLVGFLGKDPEVRYTNGGKAVASFSMGTTEKWKDNAGVLQERTEWHNITAWGGLGETVGKMLTKGWLVMVEGRLATEKWTHKDGGDRYSTKIIADSVQFLRPPRTDARDPGRPVRGGDAAPGPDAPPPDDFGPPPPGFE
jgi:single-strand DNA-binding protein